MTHHLRLLRLDIRRLIPYHSDTDRVITQRCKIRLLGPRANKPDTAIFGRKFPIIEELHIRITDS